MVPHISHRTYIACKASFTAALTLPKVPGLLDIHTNSLPEY